MKSWRVLSGKNSFEVTAAQVANKQSKKPTTGLDEGRWL